MTPLTVSEARAILHADEALDVTFETREAAGQLIGSEEGDAWRHLVKSAHERIAAYEGPPREPLKDLEVVPYPGGNEPGFQTLFMEAMGQARTGYATKHLTAEDACELAELLRVTIDDKHWHAWHPRLREIREKLIERLKDLHDHQRVS